MSYSHALAFSPLKKPKFLRTKAGLRVRLVGVGFDQYHEPPNELPQETRTFARMISSVVEEAQAIDWYEQRMAVEKDEDAQAILKDAQKEEFKHFGMDLEFRPPFGRIGRPDFVQHRLKLGEDCARA